MGSCFSFNRSDIEIIDETPMGKQFDYLRPEGTITYTVNRMYDVPKIEINFDGLYEASVCLWPKSNKMRSVLNLQRAPLSSPTFSISSSNDSDIDTVFWLFFLYIVLRMNTAQKNFKNYLTKNSNRLCKYKVSFFDI